MGDSSDRGGTRKGRRFRLPGLRFPVRLSIRFSFGGRGTPRSLRRPKPRADARRAVRFLTDARPADRIARGKGDPPPLDLRRRVRVGSIVAGLFALFVLGTLVSVFGARGFQDLRRSRRELEDLRLSLEDQQEKVTALRRAVQRLREDPTSMEGIAREQLGYARPGEVIFLLPRESPFGLAPTEDSILDRSPGAAGVENGPATEGRPGPG